MPEPTIRFWARVKKTEECWNWTGAKRGLNGYGAVWWKSRQCSPHRVAYEMEYGLIPEGMQVCHRCDNRLCVRPAHLFLGTAKENTRDCIEKGRYRNQDGEKNPHAKITLIIARAIRSASGSQREIARRLGVPHWTVSYIKTGRGWKETNAEAHD